MLGIWCETSFGASRILAQPLAGDELQRTLERGRDLFVRNCFACHQFQGGGIPGVFPPLAKSDLLTGNLEPAIRAVVAGLSGELLVLGNKYNGSMPAIGLNDQDVADVFTYVLNSWGNPGGAISAAQVKEVRSRTGFPTFEKLQQANTYPALPPPPAGFTLREVARLPQRGVRMASDGEGRVLYVLIENGDVFRAKILSRGRTREPMVLFEDFYGGQPDVKPLLEYRGLTDSRVSARQ
jgi:mono/diheme cytochrome c family protein